MHDGKLSDSSGRAKRGGRFWVELDKSENLDSIFALLLLCAVHYCAVLLTEHLEQANCFQILSS